MNHDEFDNLLKKMTVGFNKRLPDKLLGELRIELSQFQFEVFASTKICISSNNFYNLSRFYQIITLYSIQVDPIDLGDERQKTFLLSELDFTYSQLIRHGVDGDILSFGNLGTFKTIETLEQVLTDHGFVQFRNLRSPVRNLRPLLREATTPVRSPPSLNFL
jgi:hypothetical protein